jgi:hypothetical protein
MLEQTVESRLATQRAERKVIMRRNNLKRLYSITPEDYDLLLNQQNGVCAICGGVCPTGRRLSVDHDHATNKIRGLLCSRCNFGIGQLDTKEKLNNAIKYLEKRNG